MPNRKGNILLTTFILLTALAVVVGSFSYVTSSTVKSTGLDTTAAKCFYYAEAGLAKAVWFMKTPTYLGGYGFSFRTPGLTENIGAGTYKIIIANGSSPIEVLITAQGKIGTATRTIQAKYRTYPPSFDYAMFSQQKISANNGVRIQGKTYVDGDVFLDTTALVYNGNLIVTPGHTVTGGGSYTLGTMPVPVPAFPTFETTYYDDRLAAAALENYDKTGKSYTGRTYLRGDTLYLNATVEIRGEIIGPGEIVAVYNINLKQNCRVGDNVKLIAGKKLNLENNSFVDHDSVLFGRSSVTIQNNVYNDPIISVLTPGDIYLYNQSYVTGIMHAGRVQYDSTATFLGSAQIGNYGGTQVGMSNNARSYHYYSKLPAVPPPGIPFVYTPVPGTWKEL